MEQFTTKAFTLPTQYLNVLNEEAEKKGISQDRALAQAIRIYQLVNRSQSISFPQILPDLLGD